MTETAQKGARSSENMFFQSAFNPFGGSFMEDQILEWAKELQSIAQAGLFYGKDVFDRER